MSRFNPIVFARMVAVLAAVSTAAPLAAQVRAKESARALHSNAIAAHTEGADALPELPADEALLSGAAQAEMAAARMERSAADAVGHREARLAHTARFATVPPAPAQQGDSAEALYKLAREHLNQGDYRQAASLFRSLVDRYPTSKYAPDALYWRAFALYRNGGGAQLRLAVRALDEQQERFPKAATRGDADALRARINGELARGGDVDAAEQIAEIATSAIEAVRPAIDIAINEAPRIAAEASRAAAEQVGPAVDQAMRQAGEALRHAGDAVGRLGDEDRLPPECAGQQDKIEMRTAALNALLQMDAAQALPILRDVLKKRDVCSAPLRRKAVFLVAQEHRQTNETEDILLDVVRNDPDASVRGQAVFWLSQVPGEKSLKAIEEVLNTSTDPKIKERAMFALSQHNSPEASAILRRYAADEKAPQELRERAIFGLSQRHDQRENAEFLERLYKQTSDPEIKERILFALSQFGMESSDRFLMDVVRDRSQPINARKQALMQATQTGRLSTASIVELYDSPIDKDLKEPLIFALGQRPDGIDKLLDIARNEPNPGFRKRAIFWLGQSKDPRATKLLQEIINQ